MALCYLGIGGNLQSPLETVLKACQDIAQVDGVTVVATSSCYQSKPMGPQDQPEYVNAVIAIETTLSPIALLDQTQAIETLHGRVRKENRWGARTLDIDTLLFGNEVIESERLTVPHYGMKVREFVVYPLLEIAPNLILPCGTSIQSLTASVPLNGLQKL